MKKLSYLILIILLTMFSCKKKQIQYQPTLEQWEQEIRNDMDKNAVLTYSQYRTLLATLKENESVILPLYDFKDYFDDSKIIVGMRHDVDRHPFKALEIAEIENDYSINSTYYFLPTDKYYGYLDDDKKFVHINCMTDIYKQIVNLGNEPGMHNDLLTVMILWGLDPKDFNNDELYYFRRNGMEIKGTTSHGSKIARDLNTGNYEIFKEFKRKDSVFYNNKYYPLGIDSLKNFGFEYEGNFTEYNKYLYDVGGKWTYIEYLTEIKNDKMRFPDFFNSNEKNNGSYIRRDDISFDEVIEILNNSVSGDRIIILTHPVWWGKK